MDDLVFLILLVLWAFETYILYYSWGIAYPYFKSMNNPTKPLMLMLQKNRVARLLTGKYIAQTYEYESADELLAFSKNDAGSFTFGRSILDLFYDAASQAQKPEFWLTCQALKKMGVINWDNLLTGIKTGKIKNGENVIGIKLKGRITEDGLIEIGDYQITGSMPQEGEIYTPLFSQVNPHEVVGFVQGTASINKGYSDTKVNIERLGQLKGITSNPNLMALGFIIICGCIGIGILFALGVFK